MKTYSVKSIADMLKTNPETVRRWIRDNKLSATITSDKSGHIIGEAALQEFLKAYPKYDKIAKTSMAGVAIISSAMIGGLIAQKMIESKQINNAQISSQEVVNFLLDEVKRKEEIIQSKRNDILKIRQEIRSEQSKIDEMLKIVEALTGKEREEI